MSEGQEDAAAMTTENGEDLLCLLIPKQNFQNKIPVICPPQINTYFCNVFLLCFSFPLTLKKMPLFNSIFNFFFFSTLHAGLFWTKYPGAWSFIPVLRSTAFRSPTALQILQRSRPRPPPTSPNLSFANKCRRMISCALESLGFYS